MSKFARLAAACAVAGMTCAVATGCGSDDSDSSTASAAGSSTAKSASDGKKYTVGIVAFAGADPTSSLAIKGYRGIASQKGWSVSYIDPQGSADKAVAAMQNFVQKKVDMIVVTVFPAKALAAGAIAAKAANIPVVSLSGGTGTGIQVNYDSGIQQGKDIAAQMKKDTGGTGQLLALGYKSGLPCLEREQGLDAMLKTTQMKETRNEVPIPGQVEASTRFTSAWLAKNGSSGGNLTVWGCFDDPALGAISAVQSAGKKNVRIYGINGQPAAIKAIQKGTMTGTIFLDAFKAGQLMAQRTPQYIDAGVDAKPTDTPIPSILVTKDTVDSFLQKYPDALKG